MSTEIPEKTSQHSTRARPGKYRSSKLSSTHNLDLIYNDDLFNFTRGRFVVDEAVEMTQRHVRFNVNGLARVAAEAVGADVCVKSNNIPMACITKQCSSL